jgi:hypothetical protein
MLRLEKITRCPLDVLSDLVTVRRSIQERAQYEHVQRALKQV